MGENVVYLHGQPTLIGHYLRVGTSGHRQLETLQNAGRLGMSRVVFDASGHEHQKDLMTALAEAGAELILDTNIAELSTVGRFGGAAKKAPWANPSARLTADDLQPSANRDIIGHIARFAVQAGFHAVLAPTHLLSDSVDPLLAVDIRSTTALRNALDREGGVHIGIDYPLLMPYASLRDPVQRRSFIQALGDAPFENLWLRVSGFGADATASGIRRYIASMMDFHRVGRPLVADNLGGMAGLAVLAFGAAGGIAHGAADKERFDGTSWLRPPKQGGGGGHEKRILVPGLDRLLSLKQMEQLMAVPNARRHLSCNDPFCCPRGFEDTVKNPKAHYLHQRRRLVEDLGKVPDTRRPQHFLDKQLAVAERSARSAGKLKVEDEGLAKVLASSSERLEKAHAVLEDLNSTLSGDFRSAPPIRRAGPKEISAQGRR